METDDWHGWCGQFSCVSCNCPREKFQRRKKNLRLLTLYRIMNLLLRLLLLQILFLLMWTMSIYSYNQHVWKTFIKTLPLSGLKIQVKPVGKVAQRLCVTRLLANMNEPTTIGEVGSGRDEDWRKTTDSEYQSLENMNTWHLVEPPANVNKVSSISKVSKRFRDTCRSPFNIVLSLIDLVMKSYWVIMMKQIMHATPHLAICFVGIMLHQQQPTEAKYIELSGAADESMYFRRLLIEISFQQIIAFNFI